MSITSSLPQLTDETLARILEVELGVLILTRGVRFLPYTLVYSNGQRVDSLAASTRGLSRGAA